MDAKLLEKYIAGFANQDETQEVWEWIEQKDENMYDYFVTEGKSLYTWYLPKYAGVDKETGEAMDPLFAKIQKMFLQQQKDIYGTDHIYGIDLFNELEPPSYEASYLKRVAHQVYGTLEKADKNAVWLQMTWLFYNERKDWTNDRIKAYITAYPPQKSILLDYYCERHEVWQQTDKFYNVPYIWCYLGNFGGNTMLL